MTGPVVHIKRRGDHKDWMACGLSWDQFISLFAERDDRWVSVVYDRGQYGETMEFCPDCLSALEKET